MANGQSGSRLPESVASVDRKCVPPLDRFQGIRSRSSKPPFATRGERIVWWVGYRLVPSPRVSSEPLSGPTIASRAVPARVTQFHGLGPTPHLTRENRTTRDSTGQAGTTLIDLIMLRSEVRFFLAPPVRSSCFELDHFHVWGYLHIPPMCIGSLDLDVCRMSPRRLRGRRPFLGLEGRPVRRKGPGLLLQSLDRTGITGDGCGNSRSPYPIFPLCDHNSASITSRRRYVTGRGGSAPARIEGFR